MTRATLPANDNTTSDGTLNLTEKTIAGFGAVMLFTLVVGGIWFVGAFL